MRVILHPIAEIIVEVDMIDFKVVAMVEILVEVLIGVAVEKDMKEIGVSGDVIVVRGEAIVEIDVITVGKDLIVEKGLVVDVVLVDGPVAQVETVKGLIVETVTIAVINVVIHLTELDFALM